MINMIKSNKKCRLTTSVFFWGNSSTLGGTAEISERRDQALAFKLTVTLVVWLVPDLSRGPKSSSDWLLSTDVMVPLNKSDCTVDGGDIPKYSIIRRLSRLYASVRSSAVTEEIKQDEEITIEHFAVVCLVTC